MSSADLLHIAVWQAESARADVESNLAALARAAAEAKAHGAELLIGPEMFVTGYAIGDSINTLAQRPLAAEVAAVAREQGIAIIIGGPEQTTRGVTNAVWFVDEHGALLATHHKVQLFGEFDRAFFVQGETASPVVTFKGFTIGMLICFDVEFPENTRRLALAGADLIAVPTAQMPPFGLVNEHMIRVRAWENSAYVAYANQVGTDDEYRYLGQSVIASPFGAHLAEAPESGESLLFATIDRAELSAARAQNPYLEQVRTDLPVQ